ncbi:MAG: PH domain-containing protein [Armatimonadetes bacterium]|nr:PH domain-containing protein [Armatimonadota bacterium]
MAERRALSEDDRSNIALLLRGRSHATCQPGPPARHRLSPEAQVISLLALVFVTVVLLPVAAIAGVWQVALAVLLVAISVAAAAVLIRYGLAVWADVDYRLAADGEGFTLAGPHGQVRLRWADITDLDQRAGTVILHLCDGRRVSVPDHPALAVIRDVADYVSHVAAEREAHLAYHESKAAGRMVRGLSRPEQEADDGRALSLTDRER